MKKYKINLDKLWKQYPYPKKFNVYNSHRGYCVGGALCLYAKQYIHTPAFTRDNFPSNVELCSLLIRLNPALDSIAGSSFSHQITLYNDQGNFSEAKKWVKKALEYENEKV